MKNTILVVLFLTVAVFANFNRTSGVIDIPTGSVLGMGQVRFGGIGALALSPSEDSHDWDTDLSANFGLPSEIEASLTVYSSRNIVALGLVRQLYSSKKYQLVLGAHDLSYTKDVSSVGGGADSTGWDDDVQYNTSYTKPNENMSFFVAGTRSFSTGGDLTFGLGRGRYVGYGPNSRYFNTDIFTGDGTQYAIGLFVGYTFPFTNSLDLLFDLDGRDANLGLRFHTRQFEANIAAVKLEQLWADGLSSWVTAGLFYKLDMVKERPKIGTVGGTVTDAVTKMPVMAVVAIENSGLPAAATDPMTGHYTFNLPGGIYSLVASADGYETDKSMVTVKDGLLTRLDFVLTKAKPAVGQISGTVYDRKTNQTLSANLSLSAVLESGTVSQTPVGTFKSGPTGTYRFANLQPGAYRLEANAIGYSDQILPVQVGPGSTTNRDIHMIKVGMVITLKGIKFDFNKATITPESAPVLDEAAAMLENNPDIRVEIQGHTDNIGSRTYNMRLSQARAQSVVDYLVAKHGVSATRLSAQGYGFSVPVASNATETGRSENRRVDFAVVK